MMKSAGFTCTFCPVGCEIAVEYTDQQLVCIEGNACGKGGEFVRKEVYSPERILTTTIRVRDDNSNSSNNNSELPLVSVRTTKPIPKRLLFKAMDVISKVEVEAPIKKGDVLLKDILGTGADVIATRDIRRERA